MSPFAVLILCVQACLIQSVMSQCGCRRIPSYSAPAVSVSNYGLNSVSSGCANYGGTGQGQVTAAGNIDACGTTCVTGCVPVLGSVTFGGCVPASGSVSITGQCGCGCQ